MKSPERFAGFSLLSKIPRNAAGEVNEHHRTTLPRRCMKVLPLALRQSVYVQPRQGCGTTGPSNLRWFEFVKGPVGPLERGASSPATFSRVVSPGSRRWRLIHSRSRSTTLVACSLRVTSLMAELVATSRSSPGSLSVALAMASTPARTAPALQPPVAGAVGIRALRPAAR
jgi:hypothetical protein